MSVLSTVIDAADVIKKGIQEKKRRSLDEKIASDKLRQEADQKQLDRENAISIAKINAAGSGFRGAGTELLKKVPLVGAGAVVGKAMRENTHKDKGDDDSKNDPPNRPWNSKENILKDAKEFISRKRKEKAELNADVIHTAEAYASGKSPDQTREKRAKEYMNKRNSFNPTRFMSPVGAPAKSPVFKYLFSR